MLTLSNNAKDIMLLLYAHGITIQKRKWVSRSELRIWDPRARGPASFSDRFTHALLRPVAEKLIRVKFVSGHYRIQLTSRGEEYIKTALPLYASAKNLH